MTPDIGHTCQGHLAFMKWADDLMLAAVAEHMPQSIAVLQHIFLGEEVWLRRVTGEKDLLITQLAAPAEIAGLVEAWPTLHRQWIDWAAGVADWTVNVPHRNLKGAEFNMPAWQIVLHLVNHGSFHRGQAAAMLRAAGFAPPATDLIIFHRTHAQV